MAGRRAVAAVPLLLRAALLACAAGAGVPGWACAFHDQVQLARGMMNWSYPDSLHVGTAVWLAQRDGRLARDAAPARGDGLSAEASSRLRYLKLALLLHELGRVLAEAPGRRVRPNLAVVLLEPMLWSRYAVEDGRVRSTVHAGGPEGGDVVIVTEAPVIEALVAGRLPARDAVRLGVLRLYGSPADSSAAIDWLSATR